MKPGKHQRSKQRCQDLCWKVHDRAQSFIFEFRSYTMHDYVTKTFLLVRSTVRSRQLLCFVCGQGQKCELFFVESASDASKRDARSSK